MGNNNTVIAKIKWILKKVINRETITYGIAGILTTLVNFVSVEVLCRLGIPLLISNTIAWVIAVTFAYVVNKRNVFQTKSENLKVEATRITKFFGARLVTLGIEQVGLLIFSIWLGFYRLMVKAFLAIIVIIINYILSKLFIFKKDKE